MKILLAIPHTGNIRAELVQFLLSLNNYGHDVKIFLSWGRPITANRNIILNAFKEGGFDYLLTIDSDILPPDNILEMLDNKVDICSADIYTAKGNEVIRLGLEKVKEGYKAKELIEGLNEVDATGTGCLLLSKKIIEEVGEFKGDNEDFNFCERAKEKGYTIYYDTRYRCKHFQIYPI